MRRTIKTSIPLDEYSSKGESHILPEPEKAELIGATILTHPSFFKEIQRL